MYKHRKSKIFYVLVQRFPIGGAMPEQLPDRTFLFPDKHVADQRL